MHGHCIVHVVYFSGHMHVHLLSTDLERTSAVCRSSTTGHSNITDSAVTTAGKFVKDRFHYAHAHPAT